MMSEGAPIKEKKDLVPVVLLVQPAQGESVKKRIFQPGVEIPLNLACLAAHLDEEGIPSQILDLRLCTHTETSLENSVREHSPSIVGISAYSSEIANAMEVARIVKQIDQGILTVLGGHHASAAPVQSLREGRSIDCVVIGEGEVTFTHLIREWARGGDISHLKGTAFREGDRIRINPPRELLPSLGDLPFPAREKLDLNKYVPNPGTGNFLSLPSTGIMASRGCPYKCRYCSKGVWGDSIRFRPVEKVIAEIEHCIHRYGIRDFRFYDDNLTLPQWDLKGFCHQILERDIKISWNCYSRVNNVNVETLHLMKEAGCYHIKYGIEFGTKKALQLSGKGTSLDQARRAVAMTKRVGIECKGNFILGLPGEDLEDCRKTIDFALEVSPDLVSFYPFDLAPGSWFYSESNGGSGSKALPREVTEKLASQAYRVFYFRPAFFVQRARRILRYPTREVKVVSDGLRMMVRFYFRQMIASRRKSTPLIPRHGS